MIGPNHFITIVIVFCMCGKAFSQTEQRVLTHLTTNDGLSFNSVMAIHQDERGYMYFQTWKGIDRYDGIEFQNYQCKPERYAEHGYTIDEDSLGNLWYGNTLSRYVRAEESCHLITVQANGRQTGVSAIQNILLGPDQLFYLTDRDNLMILDPYKSEPSLDTLISSESNDLYQQITKIRFDEYDCIWIATDEGMFRYQPSTDSVVSFDEIDYPGTRYVQDFIFDLDGNLWAAFSHVLIKFEFRDGTNTKYYLSELDRIVINSVYHSDDGTIWLGTAGKGLYYLEAGKEGFKCLIDYSVISAIYEDRSHRLWIGTENAGVFLYDSLRNSFKHLQIKPENRIISSFHANRVLSDRQSGLWIASESLGLLFHDLETGLTSIISPEDNRSTVVYQDNLGRIWYDSRDFLICYTPGSETIRRIRHPVPEQFPAWTFGNRIASMCWFQDKLVFGSDNGEVNAYDPGKEEFSLVLYNRGRPIRAMLPEKDTLWMALYDIGIVRVDSAFSIIDTIYRDNSKTGLIADFIMAIHRDRFDSIWIGGYGGISKLNPHTMEFEGVFDCHGSSGYVSSIQEDQLGNLWIGSSNGIYKYDRKHQQYTLLDPNHGVPTGRYFTGCATQTSDGKMYFGGNNGIVYFHPEEVRLNSEVPPVTVTGLKMHAKPKRNAPVDKQNFIAGINQKEKLRLKYWQNSFTIKYASLNYTSPRYNQYKYRLVGFEQEWNNVGNQSIATYTSLKGGNYTFEIMGSNNEAVWNEVPCNFSIRIDSPPWWSWWSISLYVLVLLGIFMAIYLYNLRRLRLQHQLDLKSKESESQQEINRAKSQFFTSISHEFRTPLSLILDPAEQLFHDKKIPSKQKRFVKLILNNAKRLLFLTNQILDLAKLDNKRVKLKVEETDLRKLIKPSAQAFKSRAEMLGVEYRILFPDKPVMVWVDRDRMEQVVVNLLSNAFKFCTQGEIVIELLERDDSAWIHVRDTGVGIPADQVDRIFENYYQVVQDETANTAGTGIGLYLVKELITMHHGTIRVKSEMNKGSTFSICLEKGNKHFRHGEFASDSLSVEEEKLYSDTSGHSTGGSGKAIPKHTNPSLLIIEDNPDMMQYLADVLSKEYAILIAKDGEEGFRRALELNPDVVISDVMMPVMDGYAFCEKMKNDVRTSHIPVILLTAKTMHQDKISGLQLGADDYLQKPFHLDELKLRIHYHLELRKKIQEEFLHSFRISSEIELALSVDDKLLQTIFSHIEEHLHDDQFGVEKLSKLAGMSRKHLNNKVKWLANQTTNELIRSFRLRKAAYLLSEKGISVSEACYQVGFNNLSYFSKCFAEFYGTRPSEYCK